ncbi:MAG: 2-dehydropantoate 2-reductase [Acidobacteria bacterium]|nr:2-dehydropantoate 2-reductase [Acidobacteriota bacterium]
MRILVVGAGATGGYFGGRLLGARRDVTFLVRPRRAAQLAAHGLVVQSRRGDLAIAHPPTVLAENLRQTFDLVLLSCKAYDLDDAVAAFAPAVGPETLIVPLLNGLRHLDVLDARFGAEHVLGGQCYISSTLDAEGRILHLNETHDLSFGERDGARSARVEKVAVALSDAGFDARLTQQVMQEMWEKWVFISVGAAITCLMRAVIGDIVAGGASGLALQLLEECSAVSAGQGHPPSESFLARNRAFFTAAGSPIAASMFRDLQNGARVEADHLIGDMIQRAQGTPVPMLRVAYAHLKVYEARRARELAATKSSPA